MVGYDYEERKYYVSIGLVPELVAFLELESQFKRRSPRVFNSQENQFKLQSPNHSCWEIVIRVLIELRLYSQLPVDVFRIHVSLSFIYLVFTIISFLYYSCRGQEPRPSTWCIHIFYF